MDSNLFELSTVMMASDQKFLLPGDEQVLYEAMKDGGVYGLTLMDALRKVNFEVTIDLQTKEMMISYSSIHIR